MDSNNQLCPKREKTPATWTNYIHSASAIFAFYNSQGSVVTILSSPPPERFHPSGNTSFQTIKNLVITGKLSNRPVGRIEAVHPVVPAAQNFSYQLWPRDKVASWIHVFGLIGQATYWRPVARKHLAPILVTYYNSNSAPATDKKHFMQHSNGIKRRGVTDNIAISGRKDYRPSEVRSLQLLHTKEKKALQVERSAFIKAISLKRKRERIALEAEEADSLKRYKGRKKAKKKALTRQYKKIREALTLRHKRERESAKKETSMKQTKLNERHRQQLARILRGGCVVEPLQIDAKSKSFEPRLRINGTWLVDITQTTWSVSGANYRLVSNNCSGTSTSYGESFVKRGRICHSL